MESIRFPLQWYAIENAMKRSHMRAIQAALRRNQAEQQDYEDDPDREKPLDLSVPEYTWYLGQQTRDVEWFFDGNTFHRRGAFQIPEKLTDADLGFMKSLPFNVLRVARGIERKEPSKSVAHLLEELAQRGVKTASEFFLKTNFLDLLFSTNVIDEMFLQVDILQEYIANWEAFRANQVIPPSIPLGGSQKDLMETLKSKKSAREKYPKCPTMKCYVESIWTQRAEHKIDKEDNRNKEEKKEGSSEQFSELQIKKTTANSLKIVAIGNTGQDTYRKSNGSFWDTVKRWMRLNELETTVKAMKEWHQREFADIALGLGDFLGGRGMLSVRDPDFKTKFHDIFVDDAGLDIPWYMVNGEREVMVSSSAPYRYHYTRQDVNYHNPNWLHKAVVTVVANLTTADGGSEDQEFTVHIISVDTWTLFGGPPLYDNIGQYGNNMIALSNTLFHSAKAKADWIIVQGHHPLTSTAPEAEAARFSYIDDLVKNGRPRGPEHRLVSLLTAYQVDAYISGHDHALEYVTMSDLDKNTTLAFIASGGGTRIMDKTVGRGWMGIIRGRLFPVLCWSGKAIFYKLDPGGCKPSEKDQALAYKFYAPQGSNWKISVKERILHTTGFASMKITKDFLILDFINSRDGKPTGRKLHKKTNREARAVKFIDFWDDADLKLKELNIDHEAFEEENRERVASEIAFQTRTPILAERVRLYEKELIDMYNEYQQLKAKKAMYETMNAQKQAALEAQGENLRESELSEGMYEQTERIIELMYIIAADHTYMWQKYEALKEIRKGLPEKDTTQAEAIFKLEKKYAEVKRKRREVNKKYVDQGGPPSAADAEQIKEYVMKARILKRDIAELEEAAGHEVKQGETKRPVKPQEEVPVVKPIDSSVEGRLARKSQQLKEHDKVMENFNKLPAADKEKFKAEIEMLERQRVKLVAEVQKLDNLLHRKEWAADRRPSELWEKRLQKFELEHTLYELDAYKSSIKDLPQVQRRTKDLSDALTNVELQKMEIEDQLVDLNDELYGTQMTSLQKQYKAQMEKLREVQMLVESKSNMPPEALDDPDVKKSLEEAELTLTMLQEDVEALDVSLRKELDIQDEAWVKRMIIRGEDVKDLAEEFSIDVKAVREEDEKARQADPKRQLDWLDQQEWLAQQALKKYEQVAPEHAERYEKDKQQVKARLEMLAKLRTEAEAALAAKAAQSQTAGESQQAAEAADVLDTQNEPGTASDSTDASLDEFEVDNSTSVASTTQQAQPNTDGAESQFSKAPGGTGKRRLAAIFEWFQQKKEETPVKELQKIDMGPKDPCEGEPMLYVVVKKAINADYGANFAERCKKVFANRSHRAQRKFVGLFDDSGTPAFYEWPHVHIMNGLRELFGTTRLGSFVSLMNDVKKRVLEVNRKIHVASFQEASRAEDVSEGGHAENDEFEVADDE